MPAAVRKRVWSCPQATAATGIRPGNRPHRRSTSCSSGSTCGGTMFREVGATSVSGVIRQKQRAKASVPFNVGPSCDTVGGRLAAVTHHYPRLPSTGPCRERGGRAAVLIPDQGSPQRRNVNPQRYAMQGCRFLRGCLSLTARSNGRGREKTHFSTTSAQQRKQQQTESDYPPGI